MARFICVNYLFFSSVRDLGKEDEYSGKTIAALDNLVLGEKNTRCHLTKSVIVADTVGRLVHGAARSCVLLIVKGLRGGKMFTVPERKNIYYSFVST